MNVAQTDNEWISLSDYSIEYGVSISTLRRRIKNKKIQCRLIHGKYYLPRQLLPIEPQAFAPVPTPKAPTPQPTPIESVQPASPVQLVDELKKAYMQSLQSKEDQIIQLKQQITDLKTLVLYLERENARLTSRSNG